MTHTAIDWKTAAMNALSEVPDPEIPVISIVELGVVRGIDMVDDTLVVRITPTYTGCPAMHFFREAVVEQLNAAGFDKVEVKTVFDEVWTTDWLSDEAREKMRVYGIAPPKKCSKHTDAFDFSAEAVACPRCRGKNTQLKSAFGATACKSLYFCNTCQEPFEHFKCI